jgi:hypothetical protein
LLVDLFESYDDAWACERQIIFRLWPASSPDFTPCDDILCGEN